MNNTHGILRLLRQRSVSHRHIKSLYMSMSMSVSHNSKLAPSLHQNSPCETEPPPFYTTVPGAPFYKNDSNNTKYLPNTIIFIYLWIFISNTPDFYDLKATMSHYIINNRKFLQFFPVCFFSADIEKHLSIFVYLATDSSWVTALAWTVTTLTRISVIKMHLAFSWL